MWHTLIQALLPHKVQERPPIFLLRGTQLCCAQLCCSQTPTGWRSFACASTLISLLRHSVPTTPTLISTKRIKRTLRPFFFYPLMRGAQLCCAQLCCSQTPTGWRLFACASTLISLLRHSVPTTPSLIFIIKRQAVTNCCLFIFDGNLLRVGYV